MGAVLAMIQHFLRAGIAALALAACGDLEQGSTAARLAQGALVLTGQAAPPAPPPPLASDEDLRANPGRFIRVHIRATGQSSILMLAGQNGAQQTWINSAGISVTTTGGIVVATRGLPRDLMGADAAQSLATLQIGGGKSQRRHEFLDDQDQILARLLQCSIAPQGADPVTRQGETRAAQRFEERCTSDSLSFTNVYWIDAENRVLRSLQAISPDAGYLQIDLF